MDTHTRWSLEFPEGPTLIRLDFKKLLCCLITRANVSNVATSMSCSPYVSVLNKFHGLFTRLQSSENCLDVFGNPSRLDIEEYK